MARGHGPHLEVIGSHENVRDFRSDIADVPLIEVLGLGVGDAGIQGSIDQGVNALNLVVFREDGYIVLEGVGHP